ncbi:MAG: magnesium/cobalt transporter CorA [Nanoarchaeota archaeon]|nr:magnesium/cobalt transporter CorA [Nanoarchaeota archaeon]
MLEIFQYDGGVKRIQIGEIDRSKTVWVDMTDVTIEELAQVKEMFLLHPLTEEDIQMMDVRIKVEEFPDYLFCVFYGIAKAGEKVRMVELDTVVGKNFVITSHKQPLVGTTELKNNTQRLESLFQKGPDFIFHRILDVEIDHYFPILEQMEDEIDRLEEEVTRKAEPPLLSKILMLKRELIPIRKYVFQQKDKLSYIAKNEYAFISRRAVPYFRDVHDHTIRVHDSIENYKEALSGAFKVYMSMMSNHMNEIMKTLTIMTTLSLPIMAVSSIYGMNFAHLPGEEQPWGFWYVVLVMLACLVITLVFFKKRKWF